MSEALLEEYDPDPDVDAEIDVVLRQVRALASDMEEPKLAAFRILGAAFAITAKDAGLSDEAALGELQGWQDVLIDVDLDELPGAH